MEPSITIGSRVVSRDHAPYVVAEIGANHCGSMQIMADTVRSAKNCGADAVKLQAWTLESLFNVATVAPDTADDIRRLQLSPDQISETKEICDRVGIDLILSVFSPDEALLAGRLRVAAIKIASMDVVYHPLLELVGQLDLPVIMSTGMSSTDEVLAALDALGRPTKPCALLYCVSVYPAAESQLALGNIQLLARFFGVPVGFSDHTTGLTAAVTAAALGACIIEKHFALSKAMDSFDAPVSAVSSELSRMVVMIRDCFESVQHKSMSDEELDMRFQMRRSIVVTRDLPKGHKIQRSDMDYKRPGNGIWPDRVASLLGATLDRSIARGEQLSWDHIEGEPCND